MPTIEETKNRSYSAMQAGMARAVVTAAVAAPLATYAAPVKPKTGTVYCPVCEVNHKLSPVGQDLRWHRIKAMRATPMQVTMWDFTRFANEVK